MVVEGEDTSDKEEVPGTVGGKGWRTQVEWTTSPFERKEEAAASGWFPTGSWWNLVAFISF